MKRIAKNILGRVFALWAILVFSVSLLIIIIPCIISGVYPEPKRSVWLHRFFVIWMKFFFVFTGIRRIFKGKEHFKKGQNYIIVCNHNSMMDVPLTSPGIPGPNKTIAKIEMARTPVFGIVYKRGSVLVDRKNDESRKASYTKMKEVLAMGLHMCIYPEGTRNKTREPLQRFHDGAFRLAIETGKPVIPAVIFYTAKVLPRNKTFYFWPHPVEMHFLPPVETAGKNTATLKEEVFTIMKDYYIRHNRQTPLSHDGRT
ncbi:MAG: 1-acyl-sn-glycerol-3-phosphate acyltransferase [Flavisolibacter sp.]|nr:1-acyl-sn-glycerol-3-phosphate acyltransferase [Flavisolibacter sp.]